MAYSPRKVVQVDTGSIKYAIAEEVTSRAWSVTFANNPNRMSCIVFASRGGGTISSITRGSTTFTRAIKSTTFDGNFADIWYSTSQPTAGTATLTVNFSSQTGNNACIVAHVGLYNVDQVDPINLTDEMYGGSVTHYTNTFTPTLNDCVGVDGYHHTAESGSNPKAGQVLVYKRHETDGSGISYETNLDAQSEGMGWTVGTNISYSSGLVVFQPAKKRKGGIHVFSSMMGM